MDGATKKAGQKHATLYLPGGDIVLCSAFNDSESDPPRTLFCVSKATLAFHSPVFAGMFTLPDKPDTQDTYEGLPLVRIPDAEEELEGLLFALYSPASVTFVPCFYASYETNTFTVLSRLSGGSTTLRSSFEES